MGFCWVTVHVRDLDESIRFYTEAVGLAVVRRFASGPDMELAFLGGGETKVELIRDRRRPDVGFGTDISLGFEVDSLGKRIAHLAELGIPVLEGPFQPNPHVSFFYVLDPDGLRIQFVENIP